MKIPHRVHFVGIGGIGVSALAQHLLRLGHEVSGSDRAHNAQTAKLSAMGATVHVPHDGDICNAELVVRTSAVPPDNMDVCQAIALGVPVVLREELLGQVFNSYATRIAVCGTHGKTTVTAMVHHILERCNVPHTAFIGGEYNGNNYFGGGDVVVAEACEYNRSFLHLRPTLCLCTNVEYDHPDCYANLADTEQAFCQLFAQSDTTILCRDDLRLWPQALTFGDDGSCDDGSEICARNVQLLCGRARFDLFCCDKFVSQVRLSVYGAHNVHNALAALSVAKQLGLPMLQSANAIGKFCGADRRWTKQSGCICNVICDYAHHPTEIAATVATARATNCGRLVAVFQPHTYSRTKAFFSQFVSCFQGVDEVVYLPVYSAREKPLPGATSFALFRAAKKQGLPSKYCADFSTAAQYLRQTLSPTDTVLLVGAGNVNTLSELLLRPTSQ